MKPTSGLAPLFSPRSWIAPALAVFAAGWLAGCSTVKSVSPFTSSVPYAQDIQPTVTRPASPEVPVYTKKTTPQPEAAAPPPPPPPPPPAAAAAPPPAPPAPAAQAQPAPPPPSPPSPHAEAAPAPAVPSQAAAAAPKQPSPSATSEASAEDLPTIPAEHRTFQDDGNYPNLGQVPERPKGLPTFAEARADEKQLAANRAGAPEPAPPTTEAAPKQASVSPEDRAPCDAGINAAARPTTTIRFDQGSSTLTSDERAQLADILPDVRGGNGTIHLVGHGDTEPGASHTGTRFDLAIARAGSVAEALAGFGIPAQRIAVTVACTDAATAGASVQLYASL